MSEEEPRKLTLGAQRPPGLAPGKLCPTEWEMLDDLAKVAMGALLQASSSTDGQALRAIEPALVARYSYDYAHAMLIERRRQGGQ
jgi:hypothetical protein